MHMVERHQQMCLAVVSSEDPKRERLPSLTGFEHTADPGSQWDRTLGIPAQARVFHTNTRSVRARARGERVMSNPTRVRSKDTALSIDEASFRARILSSSATLTSWATARVVKDQNANSSIPELFLDYEAYCRARKLEPLRRKTWLACLKLAGFYTVSGAFPRLRLKGDLLRGT